MVQQPTAMPRPPIAHRRAADGEMQPLQDHLLAVGGLSARHASKLKLVTANGTPPTQLETVGEILGLVHDLGKYSKAFQDYLGSAVALIDQDADDFVDANQLRGRVDHSTAGAQFIWRKLSQTGPFGVLSGEMLALCVASHHSGLIDCLTPDGEDNFTGRISKPEQSAHLEEALARIDATLSTRLAELVEGANLSDSIAKVARSIAHLEHRFGGSRQIIQFKFGLLVRFLFSGLIDADRVDTADFERPHAGRVRHHGKYPCWEELTRRLETHLHGFSDTNPVDGLRREVSRHCRLAAARQLGLLTLTVPTGGGKTLGACVLPCITHKRMVLTGPRAGCGLKLVEPSRDQDPPVLQLGQARSRLRADALDPRAERLSWADAGGCRQDGCPLSLQPLQDGSPSSGQRRGSTNLALWV